MTGKVEQVYNRVKNLDDPFDQAYILSLLYTRIAAGLENLENKPQDVGVSDPSEIWEKANAHLARLTELDPDKTISVAVNLTLLPKSEDEEQEKVNKWIRTSGLSALGLNENVTRLVDYLEDGEHGDQLTEVLTENINLDVSNLKNAHDLRNPNGFTSVQSVYIGLGLRGGKGNKAKELYELAGIRKNEPDIANVAGILKTFPDCQYLSDRM